MGIKISVVKIMKMYVLMWSNIRFMNLYMKIFLRDYNMHISNMLQYKKTIYRRKKYLYKLFLHIKEISNDILLFFDNTIEDIRKLFKFKRISMSKYLNSLYEFYCNKGLIKYEPILKNKKIIELNDKIVEILEKNYLRYPYV